MKLIITGISILVFALLGLFLISPAKKPGVHLKCILTTEKTQYKIGEIPQLKVTITNESKDDVLLLGTLDGSESKMRYPYSYYSIEHPEKDSLMPSARCGNMSGLTPAYFVKLASGESFEPLEQYKRVRFFGSYEIKRKDQFTNVGKYKIQYHYSTDTDDFTKYLGDGELNHELTKLLQQVPEINLESNILEIEFINN